MEFQQDNSYVFYSPLRNEMIHQFGALVVSSWRYQTYSFQTSSYSSYVEIVYVDGSREQIPYPFSSHMVIDDGGGNIEEEKEDEEEENEEEENEEEEQEEQEEQDVPHPVTPHSQANIENDETDNETDNEVEIPHNEPNEEEPIDIFNVEF